MRRKKSTTATVTYALKPVTTEVGERYALHRQLIAGDDGLVELDDKRIAIVDDEQEGKLLKQHLRNGGIVEVAE